MKRLLRDQLTQAYFAEDGTWTRNSDLARHFCDSSLVIRQARLLLRRQLELVLMPHDTPSGYDLVLPLRLTDSGEERDTRE